MSIRMSGSQGLSRSANLSGATFTICGWARQIVNTGQQMLGTLDNASDLGLELYIDAGTMKMWSASGTTLTFASSPSLGSDFFWFHRAAAGGQQTGGWRGRTASTFVTVNQGWFGGGFTPSFMAIGYAGDGLSFHANMRFWSVKYWDRELTERELLIQSYQDRVMFPTSLNVDWRLRSHADTRDYSGNGRAPTVTGTLTTEGDMSLWMPRRRIFINTSSGAADITGTLASTEAADTAAIAGEVKIEGTLASTEAADTAAITGDVKIHGSLARTEANDTAAISGEIDVTGDLASTDVNDTAAIVGDVKIRGTVAATDGTDTAALSGEVKIEGALAATEPGPDTAAMSGKVIVGGDLAAVENAAQDVAAMSGQVIVQGDLAATEAHDIGAFNGTEDRIGDINTSDVPDVSAILGKVKIEGTLARTESPDLAALAGEVEVTGDLVVTEARDTSSITGLSEPPDIFGSMAATEGNDHAHITIAVMIEPGEYIERPEEPYVSSEARRFGITHGRFKNTEMVRSTSKNGDVSVTYVRNVETTAPVSVVTGQSLANG